ncbi:MAG TPA: TonB-dependent receptor [Steroidobacteraceae bacterium]|nr:TonB-dependent receptor [Steroidobacteraceae bacterium]
MALQAAETTGALEEVVVTARQRVEKIQDVPVTITAFTQTEIKDAGIQRPQDFVALTPGVAVVQTAEAGDMQINIRGINTARDAESNVALVIDGVLQTNPTALNQELAGVTQLEVLKGPQGAVYGRNAVAGAIIITTRKPGDELSGQADFGYGNFNTYHGDFYIGGPLASGVKGQLGVYTRSTDGQYHNSLLKCDSCVDFFKETGVTGRLLADAWGGSLDFKGKYSEVKAGAINFNASIALPDAAAYLGVPSLFENPNNHHFEYINNIKPENEQKNTNLSVKGEWDVGVGTLTSYLAYNDQTNYFLTDGTSAAFGLYSANPTCQASLASEPYPLPPPFFYPGFLPPYGPTTCDGYQYQQRDQSDTSFELRLTSPSNQRLRWLGGIYLADIDRHVVVSQGGDLGQGLKAQAFVPTSGPNPTDLLYNDQFKSKVYAAFGQLAYDVIDNLELALALRYDNEDRSVDNKVPICSAATPTYCHAQTPGFGYGLNPYINPAYTADPTLATTGIPSRSKTFDQLEPKISANWKITPDFSLFASWGEGFRSGGFNSTGSAATIQQAFGSLHLDDGTPNITDVNDTFKKEVSKAAEVGFKSYMLDHRLSLNLAGFYTKVDNMQYFNFFAGPFGLLRVVTNIDEVTLKGGEFDFRWKALDYLSFFGGFGITDSNIDKYTGRPYTKGNKSPYTPAYTGNLGAEFSYPVGDDLRLLVRFDSNFVGETWFSPVQKDRLPNLFTGYGFGEGDFSKQKRDPYAVMNLRGGIESTHWAATVWGKNIANKKYLQEIIPAPEFGGSFIHDSPGAAYGVDVGYKF